MNSLFYNSILNKHRNLVDKDNCKVEQVFELMLLFCSFALMLVGNVLDDYSSMQGIYIIYVVISLLLFLFTRYYVSRHLELAPIMMMVVLIECYSYSIFSGILYNLDAPSITVYALMVAACSAFTVGFSFTLIFHSVAAVIYCTLALTMKPTYGISDTVNYLFILVMSFVLTSIVNKIRIAYLQSVDDAIEQKNTAETNVILERKLRESEHVSQAKSKFLSRMSHEIRTPINAIIGIAELEKQELLEGRLETERFMEYTNETHNAAKYLLSLVNDILDSSKIDNDKIEIQQHPINSEELLSSIATLAKPLAESRNIQFRLERRTHLQDHYIGDEVRIKQIVMNLLSNAFKFTSPGGEVGLLVEAEPMTDETTTLRITVKDTGIGMSEGFQENLFQQFAQEQDSNTSQFTGSGLGLHISREFAQLMGGDIVCVSEKGQGSTFIVTVVVGNMEDTAEGEEEKTSEYREVTNFGNIHVLLCEDHPLNQRITKAMLEKKHCIVDIADDGVIGVDMFAKSAAGYYALVLMDIRMPNMDGLDAARTIRSLDREDAKRVPILAMSANTYPEDVEKSLAAGMNEHLAKPVDVKVLFHTIAEYTDIADESGEVLRGKVLIVDDIEMNRAMLSKVLKGEYDVLSAENGKEALRILETNSDILAVITDIQMPVMDGEDLVREIRKEICYDNVAILANTQFGDEKQERVLLRLGADDFVYKPITPSLLYARLKNVLAKRKQAL